MLFWESGGESLELVVEVPLERLDIVVVVVVVADSVVVVVVDTVVAVVFASFVGVADGA